MSHPLARDPGLAGAGFGLVGCLSRARWDALVPGPWQMSALLPCGCSAVVLGCGGRRLFEAFRASSEVARAGDPLDAFADRVVREAAFRSLPGPWRAVFAHEARAGVFADFVALGREAGFGAPSRLGLLVHPLYGPWLSIRAAVLSEAAAPETLPIPGFDPCRGCPAPCAAACPAGAVPPSGFDAAACASGRRSEPPCRTRCDARRACVLGRGHAYAPEAEAHHMTRSGVR